MLHNQSSAVLLCVAVASLAVMSWLWPASEAASVEADRRLARLRRDAASDKLRQAHKNTDKKFHADCLRAHNKWRRLHQAPELVFDKKIAAFAQKRADHIADSDGREFKHPPNLPYGENLAAHSRGSTSCADLVKMWYDEVSMYDFDRGDFDLETGHFTQLVWRETKRVGCARARDSRGWVYLVCNYDPPGNYLGEFRENVLRRKGSSSSARTTTESDVLQTTTSTAATPVTSSTTAATVAPAATSTRSPESGLEDSPSTTKKPNNNNNKKKSNGKRKNKNKKGNKNKKRNNNKGRNNKNKNKKKKTQNLESSTAATPATAQPSTPQTIATEMTPTSSVSASPSPLLTSQ